MFQTSRFGVARRVATAFPRAEAVGRRPGGWSWLALVVSLALLVSGAVSPLAADEEQRDDPVHPLADGLTSRQRLDALVEQVKRAQQAMNSMVAEFEQTKQSSLLLEAETSTGEFSYLAPDQIRWEYEEPRPIVMVIDKEEMTTWYPDLEQAERREVKRTSAQVFKYLGAGGSLETMTRYFALTASFPKSPENPYRLTLSPRYQRVARRLAGMEMHIDQKTFLPIYLRYEEPNGDWTEYRFVDTELNAPVSPETFELEIPASVQIKSGG